MLLLWLLACEPNRYVDCELYEFEDWCPFRECCVEEVVGEKDPWWPDAQLARGDEPDRALRCWVDIDVGIRHECDGRGDGIDCDEALLAAQEECDAAALD